MLLVMHGLWRKLSLHTRLYVRLTVAQFLYKLVSGTTPISGPLRDLHSSRWTLDAVLHNFLVSLANTVEKLLKWKNLVPWKHVFTRISENVNY